MRAFYLGLVLAFGLWLSWPGTVYADDIIHTVQPNENLFRIGLRYNVPWQTLMTANGLATTKIYVGQQLRIPTGGNPAPAETAPAVPAAETQAAPPGPVANGTYTVARGDTLAGIARRFGLSPATLAATNGITNLNWIYAGQVLVIPGGAATMTALDPAPASTPTAGKLILVDISEQHMYVYENGNLIWSWITSTGERGRDTAPGTYQVLNKIPNAYASTWNLQMPYWLGIYWAGRLQNGIHALPILANGQKLWAGWLGTPVSYGCVILGDAESQLLYNWAEVGTPVKIQW